MAEIDFTYVLPGDETTIVSGYTLENGVNLKILDGGVAEDIKTAAGPTATYIYVSAGGRVETATVNSGGRLRMFKDGYVSAATINNRGQFTMTGGFAEYTTLNGLSQFNISKGGKVEYTTVNNKATMNLSDGSASNTTVSGTEAVFNINQGGFATDTTLLKAATLNILAGGVAANVTVNKGTQVTLAAGAKLTGTVSITPGTATYGEVPYNTTITAAEGSIIDFDISKKTAADANTALYTHFDTITDNGADYTLTVKYGEQLGTYTLALATPKKEEEEKEEEEEEDNFSFSGSLTVQDEIGNVIGSFDNFVYTEISESANCIYRLFTNTAGTKLSVRASARVATVGDATAFAPYGSIADAVASGSPYVLVTGDYAEAGIIGFEGTEAVLESTGTFDGSRLCAGYNLAAWDGNKSGDYSMTISNGTFKTLVVGGDRVATAGTGTDHQFTHTGAIDLTITGGAFSKNIAGGLLIDETVANSRTQKGDITLTISGGSQFRNVYGGNVANAKENSKTTKSIVEGNITINLDLSTNDLAFSNVIAGSYNTGKVNGSTEIRISGSNDLTVRGSLLGGCEGDSYKNKRNADTGIVERVIKTYVSGERTLTFTGFSGDLNIGQIAGFSNVNIEDSNVNFGGDPLAGTGVALNDVNVWNINADSTVSGYFANDFANDSIFVDLDGWEGTKALFDTNNGALKNFASAHVYFDGKASLDFDFEEQAFISQNASVKLALSESGRQLILSTIA